eukprot:UN18660
MLMILCLSSNLIRSSFFLLFSEKTSQPRLITGSNSVFIFNFNSSGSSEIFSLHFNSFCCNFFN